jgi:S-formylglutathione hydrolase
MLETITRQKCFGGEQIVFAHDSAETRTRMRFSVFAPPQAAMQPVPALIYLAGLTCNEETFMIKGAAQRFAAEHGLALVAPDTSPRGAAIEALPGATDHWDFGVGAGFYLDATAAPWSAHWRMESYIVQELLGLLPQALALQPGALGIFGHSMGGHGALTLALRHPQLFKSVSAFAPIAAPSQCAWGQKAFSNYLGPDKATWAEHDATELMLRAGRAVHPAGILIDQGTQDKFLLDGQLLPKEFAHACASVGQPLTMRPQAGYDHGYYFVSTFMEDHVKHHARILQSTAAGAAA